MRIIARRTLREYYETNPETRSSLEAWYHEVKQSKWSTPADLKAQFPTASIVGKDRAVFRLLRNRFRLVVAVNYEQNLVFVRFIGTHKEYDAIDVKDV
jgi:mRNA interferase HigB